MTFFNHYSYAISAVLSLVFVGTWALRRRTLASLATLSAVAVLVVGVGTAFRPGEPTVEAASDFDRAIADGRPTLVEFYSNY